MLRIHFTADDLARVRVAPTLGPLSEAFLGLHQLTGRNGCPQFRPWRRLFSRTLGDGLRPLASLSPHLDIGTLTKRDTTVEGGLDHLLGTPDRTFRLEVAHIATARTDPRWHTALQQGDLPARRLLADSLAACHDLTVGPHWGRLRARLDAVRAEYGRTLVDGGVEQLLATAHPQRIRWRAPVLEVDYPRDGEVHLEGRGLVLAPVVFLPDPPVLLTDGQDPQAPPTLAIPAVRDVLTAAALWSEEGNGPGRHSLNALLGRTRAAALDAVSAGCTTTELALRLNVSPASASQHATVLRNANLITTQRRGGAVLHTITPLGIDLLNRTTTARAPERAAQV
ncbi:winged helix-turn-helix transcriptional regulator [Kitasatospora sp. RG8]|uniref:ArsR/SmtB family transcription factor n=1 Tax=Kitasatospora sp. RG8 TaxID=2820815 RepID=UPI001AE0C4E1|nr:winged helix-turn-helix domain-containing protein [Kitasatospora sp. RG8]MBP0452745.1 winged helix-turn-helix transcriptional regulator [Kitasatospora sp. RG8]